MKKIFFERLAQLKGSRTVIGFAKSCGCSETGMRSYLEKKSEPTLGKLQSIAKANHVSVAWLIGESDERTLPERKEGPPDGQPEGCPSDIAKACADPEMLRLLRAFLAGANAWKNL